jgi:NAD(P)-dependent dehydrogenase (short-subunit alcohol dehydrogenase family)
MKDAKRVVITGCTRGLGRAMACGFAERGWVVAGCGTRLAAVEALAAELGAPHWIRACDVSLTEAVQEFAAGVLESLGPPDLLVNNAGVINAVARLWEVPVEEFARVMDVNVNGIHRVCCAFLPAMISAGRGVVVNFSSGWGRSTSPEVAPYCASKWAIEGLTRALAQELPSGMAAVALNPGIIDTDMLRSCWGEGAGS